MKRPVLVKHGQTDRGGHAHILRGWKRKVFASTFTIDWARTSSPCVRPISFIKADAAADKTEPKTGGRSEEIHSLEVLVCFDSRSVVQDVMMMMTMLTMFESFAKIVAFLVGLKSYISSPSRLGVDPPSSTADDHSSRVTRFLFSRWKFEAGIHF